jgi:hypothetical protein
VVAAIDVLQARSDGGAVLLKSLDTQLQLTKRLAACLVDRRQPGKVKHQTLELVRQRVFGLACGYADCLARSRPSPASPPHGAGQLIAPPAPCDAHFVNFELGGRTDLVVFQT